MPFSFVETFVPLCFQRELREYEFEAFKRFYFVARNVFSLATLEIIMKSAKLSLTDTIFSL